MSDINQAHNLENSSGNYKIFLIILYTNGVSSAYHKVAVATPYFLCDICYSVYSINN